jgi:hypothetical protein
LIERDRVKMRKAADSSSGHLIERVKIRGLGVPVPRCRVDWGWEADEEEEEQAAVRGGLRVGGGGARQLVRRTGGSVRT